MGGFAAAAPLVLQGMSAAATIAGTIGQIQNAKSSAAAQANQQALQQRMLVQQQQQRERQQQNLLKRQLAATRAGLAAGGMGFSGGSGAALMAGMTRSAQQDIADQRDNLSLGYQAKYGDSGSGGSAALGLAQGLEAAQKIYGAVRPLIV